MAAGVVANASISGQGGAIWRQSLLALCAIVFALIVMSLADMFGLGGRPWYGNWDSSLAATERPFIFVFPQAVRGGASARAGIRDGDTADLREQSLDTRVARIIYGGISTTRPTVVIVHRGDRRLRLSVVGSTVWEVQPLWKLPNAILQVATNLWFLGCALLIALRASASRAGRILAIILLLTAIPYTGLPTPNAVLNLLIFLCANVLGLIGTLLLIYLAAGFGQHVLWRRLLEAVAYGSAFVSSVPGVMLPLGLLTLWFDPLPYWLANFWVYVSEVVSVAVLAVAAAAVATTQRSERARTAWLLLPLPISFALSQIIGNLGIGGTWYAGATATLAADVVLLLGAAAVTYALLKRRVFDFGFVLSRTIVVAIVSLIVVVSFVLLEWLLGMVVAGVSHATTLVANAALALIIGVSLGYIQKRVDALVDMTLFRKRHEDERALRAFSKEAAYATDADALLDEAIRIVERHTDARNAAILLDRSGEYAAVRSFGDGATAVVGENDGAILALKAWHKPVDPHHCSTALRGALALPMLARGKLLGVLLSGERAGGEAYAPDEVEALSQFAHGVGSAIDALSADRGNIQVQILSVQEGILAELRSLPAKLADAVRRDGV